MFHRSVAGSAMGALVIGLAALALASFGPALSTAWPLTAVWCFVPLVWGIWAMLIPRAWFPERLPYWGAILGCVAGTMCAFVLNLGPRVFGLNASIAWRVTEVATMTVIYYFLWMLVRATYRNLTPAQLGTQTPPRQMKMAA
jgi:hypothetical protein